MCPDRLMGDQNIFSSIFRNNICTFMKVMHLFTVLSHRPGSTAERGSEISRCRARYRVPMVPPGTFGCQTGWEFTGRAALKTESMRCRFCLMARLCGQVF